METGDVKGIMGEGLSIELNEGTVPFLGKLPDDSAWYFHVIGVYKQIHDIAINLPYLIAKNLTSFENINNNK